MNVCIMICCQGDDILNGDILPPRVGLRTGIRAIYEFVEDKEEMFLQGIPGGVFSEYQIPAEPYHCINLYKDDIYEILFGNANYIDNLCKRSLVNICESAYIRDWTQRISYLFDTFDGIDPRNYKKEKVIKLVFTMLAIDKADYLRNKQKYEQMKNKYRNPILHGGKSIFEIEPDINEIKKVDIYLRETIMAYCLKIHSSSISTWEELDQAYINTVDMFPPSKIIDVKSVAGYSKVANEFTEEKRITTKNFHKVSQNFWEHFIGKLHIGDSVLELRPGNGWLRNRFEWPVVNYNCVDIASNMKAVLNMANGIVASARCIPIMGKSIDCVVVSLADPYFYPEALCEVNRILKDEALFAVTLPDKEWADNLRGVGNHKTSFSLDEGDLATVFSFRFSDEEIAMLAEQGGFSINQLTHLCGVEL